MNSDADIQGALRHGDADTSSEHDAVVLAAARGAAVDIAGHSTVDKSRKGAPGSNRWPLALAASFALGIAMTIGIQALRGPALVDGIDAGTLTIPVTAVTRGDGNPAVERDLPVSEADPRLWFEYIQELVYNGELAQAEQHIRAFRQMHSDYRYTP